MAASLDVFPFRPLGEHPAFLRRQAWEQLASPWDTDKVRLLCPPVDLISPTLRKLQTMKDPAAVDTELAATAVAASSSGNGIQSTELKANPAEIWAAQRRLNPFWRLLLLEINM